MDIALPRKEISLRGGNPELRLRQKMPVDEVFIRRAAGKLWPVYAALHDTTCMVLNGRRIRARVDGRHPDPSASGSDGVNTNPRLVPSACPARREWLEGALAASTVRNRTRPRGGAEVFSERVGIQAMR